MLFVTFLLSGIVLFLVIYAYSVLQLKRQNGDHDARLDSNVVAEPASIANSKATSSSNGKFKIPFLDKLKRKTASDDDSIGVEDSSMTVGGVTAKVASSVIESVKSASDETLPKEQRVAPTLSKTAEDLNANIAVGDTNIKTGDAAAGVNKYPQGFEPIKPDLEKIAAKEEAVKRELKKQEAEQIESEKAVALKQETQATGGAHQQEGAPLEELAEEYAAKEAHKQRVSPDEIAQALLDQPEVEQLGKNNSTDTPHLNEEDAQQDLLAGQNLFAETEAVAPEASREPELKSSQQSGRVNKDVAAPVQQEPNQYEEIRQEVFHVPKKEFKAGANAIEIVAKISGSDPVLRDKALTVYRRYDYLFTRHIGIYGRNTLTHVWEDVEQAGQEDQFDDIAVSLQLADKTGAMTRKESNTFSTLAIEMADGVNKKMEFSMDVDESVEKGRMLDELARKYDAMVVCNIIPKRRKGFRSTDIKSCTKDLQMLPAKNGVFGRFAKVGQLNSLRYSLALADADGEYISASTRDPFQVDEIVVFMNVPLVKNPTEAFDDMIRDARKLAAWMDGKIVDKNARNMTSRTLDKIAEQISLIEKEMSLDGLLPGSEICKKLF